MAGFVKDGNEIIFDISEMKKKKSHDKTRIQIIQNNLEVI